MIKLLIVFILLFLSGCVDNINESLFIASIGIEKKEGELKGYFYLPLSNDIGKTDSPAKGSGEFLVVGGKTVYELFNNAKAVNSLNVNLRHVSSVVINKELFTPTFLDEFINYVKNTHIIDYNFYFMATKEKLEDIYSFQNPNQESVLNSLLVISGDNEGLRLVAEPVHYLDFVKRFYDNRSILLPLLEMEELWHINNEKVKNFYPQSGMYYFMGNIREVNKEKGSPYLKDDVEFYDEIEKEPIYFSKYRLALMKESIKINADVKCLNRQIDISLIEKLIKTRIKEYFEKYKDFDPLDRGIYKTSIKDFKIDVSIKILNS